MSRNEGKDNFGLITDDELNIEGRLPSEEYITMTGDFAKGPERLSDYLDINDDVFEMASLKASKECVSDTATYINDEMNIPITSTHSMQDNFYVERECPIKSKKTKKGMKSCVYAVTTLPSANKELKPRAINKSFSTKQIHRQDLYSYATPCLPTMKKSQSLDVLPGSISMQSLSAQESVSSVTESSSEIYLTPTKGTQSAAISGMDSELHVGRCQNELGRDVGNSLKKEREESDELDQSFQLSSTEFSGKTIY
eukprot:Seg4796.1 transcript_id=Seg4796.1/GoldUCD/mRNA.D3Y31 product="hypothetical protein" protein_id=Seg4796.1/GoldUCD/D3Y31